MASSKGAVVGALIGNSFLTVVKFGAFATSGSGSMFSEGMHSLADTANQALLLVGINSSERPANAMFPYGYGADRYLFSLLSAVGIFVLGCGVTLYHGIDTLLHPHHVTAGWLDYSVLGVAGLVDGAVLFAAVRAIWSQKGEKGFLQYLRTTTDPTVLAVLLEDSVAILGVLAALLAISLTSLTGNPVFDSFGALAVSGMLGGVAIWLGLKNRSLLLGPSVSEKKRASIRSFLELQPAIKQIHETKTRVVGAQQFRLQVDVDFDGANLGRRLTGFVSEQAEELGKGDSVAHEAFAAEFGDRLLDLLGEEVDAIEAELTQAFPDLKHVDIEAD